MCTALNVLVIFFRQIVVAKQNNIGIKWMVIFSGLKENYVR